MFARSTVMGNSRASRCGTSNSMALTHSFLNHLVTLEGGVILYLMKWYVLKFKYAGEWHMNVVKDPNGDSKSIEEFRSWLIDATRFSIDQLGIKDDRFPNVEEANANELKLVKNGDPTYAELVSEPIDAVANIHLTF